jgi:hypothetical protein
MEVADRYEHQRAIRKLQSVQRTAYRNLRGAGYEEAAQQFLGRQPWAKEVNHG